MNHKYFCFPLLLFSSVTFGFGLYGSSPKFGSRVPLLSVSALSQDENTCVDVRVFDNVFHPTVCEVIRALSVEGTFRRDSEETCIFIRPPSNETALTPIEHAMDSALNSLGDMSRLVEYWYRDEFMNIDTHVDIDEIELEKEGNLRAPKFSHVLYLQVKDELKGNCPTCVFPSQQVGWNSKKIDVDLVAVPAVQGRLLRFPGSAMHAVPCPANRWLLTDDEEALLREEEECYDDDEDDLDDENDYEDDDEDNEQDDDYIERAVLLFNTWSDDGPPPRDVLKDYESELHTETQRIAEWHADYGVDAELLRCEPKSMWQEAHLTSANEATTANSSDRGNARINLMGEINRRISHGTNVQLSVSRENLQNTLHQDMVPTLLRLRQES
mmetsp:Transcript_31596/g.35918  ORF Transcript_31596/g.35918 Transcript_31596/m.35918 type:complete len:384 (+) Transcript_31596:138-1289(+)|eukprot:CAMPEP_0194137706 /NCGR_PEP_ID=MMETSP0152-20130528/7560_1 /TAXON_ID=1049557 /ORGANISM="Thalassiothrix antarctica, Strain L6-D1" /LENGTH=383 /DNA_ID=CAMNT_0038834837 /DNA_START=116 /DNA_END=1267 /DNA_ORIENTATION=+